MIKLHHIQLSILHITMNKVKLDKLLVHLHKPLDHMAFIMYKIYVIFSCLQSIEGFVILQDIQIENIQNISPNMKKSNFHMNKRAKNNDCSIFTQLDNENCYCWHGERTFMDNTMWLRSQHIDVIMKVL